MSILNGIIRMFEAATVAIGGFAYWFLIMTVLENPPAPALAAASSTFAALVIIPYCMARMLRIGVNNNKAE